MLLDDYKRKALSIYVISISYACSVILCGILCIYKMVIIGFTAVKPGLLADIWVTKGVRRFVGSMFGYVFIVDAAELR